MRVNRAEFDFVTKELTIIEQIIYSNGESTIVLDFGVEAPEGFVELEPTAEE